MFGTKVLEERKSKYNGNLRVVKTWGMGIYIQADGLTQSGGIVESIWKSTLRKIHDSRFQIRNVLILGLGGGTVARLIRNYWPEAKITGVDIDPIMIELGTRYLGLDRNEIEIEIEDAYNFLNQNNNSKLIKYDLIVIDLYQGDSYPKKFATENYIHHIRHGLARSGVAIFNKLYFKDKKAETEKFGGKLEKIFGKVERFYPEANLMLICRHPVLEISGTSEIDLTESSKSGKGHQ